ncbi:hypothetical protein F7725_000212 [Dissostichus mawsoni]|uniref:Uncharacterized protein n=1 Tax=Dissostichus mawsoni TaxID=36200 RepID=A0A7J5ZH31_DISMA|nr:hypothetical protein F7725_000212 [Dissostichus mawsoni]
MNTYWLVGHKNYSVQNDSLVCHWNPGMARKKKAAAGSHASVGDSSVTVQSLGATTPVSIPPSVLEQPPPVLSVAAQMEPDGGSSGTLGSMMGGCRGGAEPPAQPAPGRAPLSQKDPPDLKADTLVFGMSSDDVKHRLE